jgi:hypothetical protein
MSELDGRGLQSRSAARHARRLSAAYRGSTALCLCMACALSLAPSTSRAGDALPTNGQYVAGQGSISGTSNNLTVNQSTSHGIINWQSFSIGTGNSVFVTLTTTGSGSNMALYAPVTGSTVDLVSSGNISQNSSGIITAATLTGSSVSVTSLHAQNVITDLGNFTTDNATFYLNDAIPLTETGTVNAGTGSVTVVSSGTITVDAPQTVPGSATLTLDASGALAIDAPITVSGAGQAILDAGYDTTTVPGSSLLALSFGSGGNISYGGTNNGGTLTINGTPYTLLYTMSDVQNINSSSAALSANYALADSPNAASVTSWVPLGTNGNNTVLNSGNGFSGTFEGLGNTISNLTVNIGFANDAGLFGYVSGTIEHLGVQGGSVTGYNNDGGLAGYLSASGKIVRSYSTAAVTNSAEDNNFAGSSLGGLVGWSNGVIADSHAGGTITGADWTNVGNADAIGGLVGTANEGQIVDSYASGNVSGYDDVGGLVGYNSVSISNSYATGSVTGLASNGNGFGGGDDGENEIGGLVGQNLAAISNSTASDAVNGGANGQYIGGLVGRNGNGNSSSDASSVITNSTASGVISGGYGNVGGLAGRNDGSISGSSAIANIDSTNASGNFGGLVGYNYGSISTSTSSGSVSASNTSTPGNVRNVGGLVGSNTGSISQSYSTASATGDNNIGGLVGINLGTIANTYSTGAASGDGFDIGGLVGTNQGGSISTSYTIGAVSGGSVMGGFVGNNIASGTITYGYWDTTTAGVSAGLGSDTNNQSGNVHGLTTAELQSGLPTGFDPTIWGSNPGINDGLPYLLALSGSY